MSIEFNYNPIDNVFTLTLDTPECDGRPLELTIRNPPAGFPIADPARLLKIVRGRIKEEQFNEEASRMGDFLGRTLVVPERSPA